MMKKEIEQAIKLLEENNYVVKNLDIPRVFLVRRKTKEGKYRYNLRNSLHGAKTSAKFTRERKNVEEEEVVELNVKKLKWKLINKSEIEIQEKKNICRKCGKPKGIHTCNDNRMKLLRNAFRNGQVWSYPDHEELQRRELLNKNGKPKMASFGKENKLEIASIMSENLVKGETRKPFAHS